MRVVAWELTKRCMLKCKHCRAGAENISYSNELSSTEAKLIIDSLSKELPLLLILTGGEPLMRQDIYEISSYASLHGISVVMATCGSFITVDTLTKLKTAGVQKLSFSIDGYDEASHDEFRGQKGAFSDVIRAAHLSKEHDMLFQINTTLTKSNCNQIEKINDLANQLGADIHDIFILIPTGRADSIRDELLDCEEYEKILRWIANEVLSGRRKIRVTCAPHYSRIFQDISKELEIVNTFKARPPSACMGGRNFFFISNTGQVYPCGFFPVEGGDLRKNSYDFLKTIRESKLFNDLKNKELYSGKCSVCSFFNACGGCRARALAVNGNYLGEEPFCSYIPGVTK
ncbi:MAG TPA: radical SAM/SPASM domain-containing protein [Lentisphaeria bacterium]|nr:MAG: hypothetical protein A2X47_03810 [Lentisphaerae bacterium GWF2_38_69]HBM17369.1 radical SAM/SPASM domain-containing protein [Lentisphaeria bacterium]